MMRNSNSIMMAFLFLVLLSLCKPSSLACHEKEKQALLRFKQSLTDSANRLSSWSFINEDCCGWAGVRCDNVSGLVVELHLGNPYYPHSFDPNFAAKFNVKSALGGEISPALLELEHLHFLNLSFNDFGGAPIPSFLGSMKSLTSLDLWGASFGGLIPHQLGNLSSLRLLVLGGGNSELYVDNFSWISHLSSLEILHMSWVDLHRDVHWLDSLTPLSSLSELHLPNCQLNNMISSLGYVNFTSLRVLHLPSNFFSHDMPPSNFFSHDMPNWLFNLTSLLYLDLNLNSLQGHIQSTISNIQNLNHLNLSANKLTGHIPDSLGQLKHLKYVSLHHNSLCGPIPSRLGNLSSLAMLILRSNKLNGTLPKNLGFLSNLVGLRVSTNSIEGTISEVNFAKLSKLKYLDMSLTSVVFNVSQNWIPPFQLKYIWLDGCKAGPMFPAWLRTQRSLHTLSLFGAGIVGTIPKWFWKWASYVEIICLNNNQISGDLSHVLLNNTIFVADSNCFVGQLPHLSPNVAAFSMSNNSLSGQISSFLCQKMNGRSKVAILDLSNNALSGELGHGLMHWQSLVHLNLGSNNLCGEIPKFIGSLVSLKALHLHCWENPGGIPLSLRNWTTLSLIDFAENNLTGNIPSWIGERTHMMVLRLSSNEFFGNIPQQICQLSSLIVLDLADNRLSGSIPRCLNNISTMATTPAPTADAYNTLLDSSNFRYPEHLLLVIKGKKIEYGTVLPLMRTVDLSCNNLSGIIPIEISSLFGLKSLNLSRNHLMGSIPEKIGSINNLESLDLSYNHLSGEIPQSICNLTFLSVLNLSYNDLSGRIPSSTQLQSFNAVDFIGSPELCGAPLLKNCTENVGPQGVNPSTEENGEISERSWFFIGMTTGFTVSFWGVCGSLLCKRAWRHAYFNFLDNIKDRVFVATVLNLNSFRHHFRR